MASFTDQIQSFTPYTPEQPVQALVSVGMEKQRLYEEGVKTVEDQLDAVAGLPIAKQPVKQYLQQKLDEVKKQVSGGIAADYSNQRLVSHVTGLTKQIGGDPIIQKGVQNTLQMQANDEEERKEYEEGKPNMANSYVYRQGRDAWLNDGKLDSTFNSQYNKYIDVNAKLVDAAKAVGEDERIVQQLFKTDSQGNVIVGPDGKPMISDYITEQHFKGKDFKKLYNYFITSLTPSDYNQLGITGRYINRDKTPEDLLNEANNSYVAANKEYLDRGLTANIKLAGLQAKAKKTKQDEDEIAQLTSELADYDLQLSQNEKNHQQLVARINEDPEGVKASMYSNDYILNTARALSSTSEYTLFKDNPAFKAWVDRQQLNQGWQRLQLENNKFQSEEFWRNKNFGWDTQKFYLEHPELAPGFNNGREGTVIPPSDFLIAKEAEAQANHDEMIGASQQIAIAAMKSWNSNKGKNISDQEALESLKYWADKLHQPIEDVAMRFSTRYLEELKKDKKAIDKPYASAVETFNDAMTRWQASSSAMQKATDYAVEQARLNGKEVYDEKSLLNKIPTTQITIDGKKVNLTKQDLLDFAYVDSDILSSDYTKSKKAEAINRLESKYNGITKSNKYIMSFQDPNAQVALQTAKGLIYSEGVKNLRKYQEEFFSTKGVTPINKEFDLFIGKGKDDDFKSKLSNVLSKYSPVNGDIEDAITSIQTGKGNVAAKVVVVPSFTSGGENKYQLAVTSDGKTQNINISEEDAKYFTGKPQFNRYITTPEVDLLRYSNNGSTNTADPSSPIAWKTSAFNESKFPGVNLPGYTLNADFVADRAVPNSGWLKLYLVPRDGSTPKQITMGATDPRNRNKERPMTYDELSSVFSLLTTDDIIKELK